MNLLSATTLLLLWINHMELSVAFITRAPRVASSLPPTIQWAAESLDATLEKADNSTVKSEITLQPTQSESAVPEETSEVDRLFQKVKDSGKAGAISLGLWEGAFWLVSIPVAAVGFQRVTGHWPDLVSNPDDRTKLGAEAFAVVNFARFAVPLRVGLALATTPWVQENIVDVFFAAEEGKGAQEELGPSVAEVAAEVNGETNDTIPMTQEEEMVSVVPEDEAEKPRWRWLGRLLPKFLRKRVGKNKE